MFADSLSARGRLTRRWASILGFRVITTVLLGLVLGSGAGDSLAQRKAMISKGQLLEMFESISEQTDWDTSGPLLWGYFFTDPAKEKLEALAPFLEAQGYRVVRIYLPESDASDEPPVWWLHVEKVEVHTPDTLHERNGGFYKLAEEHGLMSYDGMDVGPVP